MRLETGWFDHLCHGSCNWCTRHLDLDEGGHDSHRVFLIHVPASPRGGGHVYRFCEDCVIEAAERRLRGGMRATLDTGNLLDMIDRDLLERLMRDVARDDG